MTRSYSNLSEGSSWAGISSDRFYSYTSCVSQGCSGVCCKSRVCRYCEHRTRNHFDTTSWICLKILYFLRIIYLYKVKFNKKWNQKISRRRGIAIIIRFLNIVKLEDERLLASWNFDTCLISSCNCWKSRIYGLGMDTGVPICWIKSHPI